MKKIFLILIFIIVLILGSIYGILFTKYGNSLIATYIENRVNKGQDKVKLKVNDFNLTLKKINLDAKINDDSIIKIYGDLSLLKQSIDLKYNIKINDLASLKNLTNQEFKGPFSTNGTFIGNKNEATIEGDSNIASSKTKYYVNLMKFEVKNIYLDSSNLKIEELLSLINKPIYTKGNLNLKADIKNIDIDNLDGELIASISKGKINNKVINKEFSQKIQTSINFESDINAKLLGNEVEIKSELLSSIADLYLNKTNIDLKKNKIQSDYKIDVKNLSKLESIISKKLNGEFITQGDFILQDSKIVVKGNSNILESKTSYKLKVKDSSLQNINFEIENAKVEKLLHMLNEPIYARGDLDIKGDIQNANLDKLDGVITTKISDGKLINEVLNAVFKQELKNKVTMDMQVDTKLVPNQAISKALLDSNLAKLIIEKAIFDFKDNSFKSDYLLKVASLENLKDFTKTKLRGSLDLRGEIQNKNNSLFANGKSDILKGSLDFELKDNKLTGNLNNISVKELTYMTYQPEIFNSNGSFKINYNLLEEQGVISGKLINGHFLENNFSNMINQLSKFDLTREIYESVDINSNINKNLITSSINMKSKNTTIDMNKTILDLEKNTINAKVDTKIKKSSFSIIVKGDTSKPKISLDAKDLLKEEVNKQIEKRKDKIEEKLNKVLGGKIEDEKAKELIKNLKSIF